MAKEPERMLTVYANPGKQQIEIILLADGSPIGSIIYTQDQAEQHARAVVEAIELVNQRKSSLLLPEKSSH
jgi:pyridoxal biosynthesis lyase PdxS